MAKDGFRILDSDMHIMEPPDLWLRYVDEQYRSQAPVGVTSNNVRDLRMKHPEGALWGSTTVGVASNPNQPNCHNFERNQSLYGDHSSRGWPADAQLEAMYI